jgi:hypothetical protein
MAQQNINYGAYPDDPTADPIRIAFEKTQNNFTELYGNLSNVASNVTAISNGAGILTSASTGNVTISAIFSALTVTSNSLFISGTGGYVPLGGNYNRDYTINNAIGALSIDLDQTSNLVCSNIVISNNMSIAGNSIAAANANITLGNITLATGTLLGNVRSTGPEGAIQFASTDGKITGNASLIFDQGNATLETVTVLAVDLISQFRTVAAEVTANRTLAVGVQGNFDMFVANTGIFISRNTTISANTTITGNANISGNLTVGNITATSLGGDGSRIFDINASNIASGTIANARLAGNYAINITGTAASAGTIIQADQPNITTVGNLTALTVDAGIIANSVSLSGNIVANNANLFGNLSVATVTSSANISAQNLNVINAISAQDITVNANITANNVSVNTVAANTVTAIVQLTSLTSDPVTGTGGQMYYNSVIGKFRGYNALTGFWESLN